MTALAEFTAYLLVASVPAGLLVLYAVFRWRYLTAIRNTLYSAAPNASDCTSQGAGLEPRESLVVHWVDPVPDAPPPRQLVDSWRATRDMRRRFAAAGAVHLLSAAVITWFGQRTVHGSEAAVALAYFSTLPALVVILAFLQPRGHTWVIGSAAWAALGGLLLAGPLGVPWSTLGLAFWSGLGFASYGLVLVVLLLMRASRSLLVGFVPLIAIWLGLGAALAVLTQVLGITFAEAWRAPVVTAALLAAGLGVGLGVWLIRRGLRPGSVAALLITITGGAAAVAALRVHGVVAFVAGVAFHALFTIAVWYLFTRFVRLKMRGVLPDDVLHFSLCWLGLTALLPAYAGSGMDALWCLVPIASYAVILQRLLTRRRRTPGQMAGRMVLLRVFSRGALRSRLLDLLDDTWRRVGRIDLIVGVDLAVRTLSAAALGDFLLGRTDRQFLNTRAEADTRLAALPNAPAADGRYPLNELHCRPDVWRHVVRKLARDADVVLMDLRGFRATNLGVIYELSVVLNAVLLTRTVLFTDASTDEAALTDALRAAWGQLSPSSPNAVLDVPRIELIRWSRSRERNHAAILNRVFTACQTSHAAIHLA